MPGKTDALTSAIVSETTGTSQTQPEPAGPRSQRPMEAEFNIWSWRNETARYAMVERTGSAMAKGRFNQPINPSINPISPKTPRPSPAEVVTAR
jgi:hypothetical protein